jgi:hypothetical protein
MQMRKRFVAVIAGTLLAAAWSVPQAYATIGRNGILHVLLISIDGFHALDYLNCSQGISGVNNGQPYCPTLAALGTTGVNYLSTSTSTPSDSFPGLMALMTGGSPRTMGVNYDVAYDRALNPPQDTTGNGLAGGPCSPTEPPPGTGTEYDEGININEGVGTGAQGQMFLNGGAPSGDGGVNSIDSTRLVRDQSCSPIYPWNFVRVNTIYGVIHAAGGYTAWSDKHPSYSSVGGPTGTSNDSNLDDYYSPEINSNSQDFSKSAPPQLLLPMCQQSGAPILPDQNAVTAGDDYTGSFQNIQCYDGLKVNAIINEINGKNHDGTAPAPVPTIFGLNFQAVSIGQKLIYTDAPTVPSPYTQKGGYTDSIGTPSGSLEQEIIFVDNSIKMMVQALQAQGLLGSTLIIITAKHGQSPVDSSRYVANGSPNDPASILTTCLFPSETSDQVGPTEDDVALLWLDQTVMGCDTSGAVSTLENASPAPPGTNKAGIGQIFSGPSIGLYYNNNDSRKPDILITPNIGVTYSNSTKKLAEHGGFAHDDTNVILLVSNPSFPARTITTPVQTKQVAPSILVALGLNPASLQADVLEGTQALPGLP